MITAEDIILEIMEGLGFTCVNKELGFSIRRNQAEKIFVYDYDFEAPKGKSHPITKSIKFSPGGVLVKKLTISDNKVTWKHRNEKISVHLYEPDSIDKILAYAKAED